MLQSEKKSGIWKKREKKKRQKEEKKKGILEGGTATLYILFFSCKLL
jgi:hypothetical protein